jgi:hypothetical protein
MEESFRTLETSLKAVKGGHITIVTFETKCAAALSV